jgi:hypothetical protein
MDLWSVCLVLTHLHPHRLHHPYLLQQQLLEPRVSVLSFQTAVLFLWVLPFALLCFSVELPLALFPFRKYVMRVALYLAQWPHVWLPRLLLTWVAAPLALSFETLGLRWAFLFRTILPRLIILRTIFSKWTRSRWSPWLAAGCPLSN